MSTANSTYSPLPQSNSDTDESSEELHSSHESRVINRISKSQNPKPELIVNGQRQKITNYKPLDNEREIGITLNGFHTSPDEVSILKADNESSRLSTSRKLCFIFSIFLCVFTIVVFLWVLPCDVGSCPPAPANMNSWEKILLDLELHGPISVVPGAVGRSQNLVFLLKSSFNDNKQQPKFPPDGGGIISLLGKNGEGSWLSVLKRQPKDIDCSLIDVNLDGFNDCIVVGDSLLKAIHSVSGTEIWNVHTFNEVQLKVYELEFPIVLPDLDGDKVNELVTWSSSVSSHNLMLVISGRTGTIIGQPVEVKECSTLHNLVLEKDFISYTCVKSTMKESVETMSLSQLMSKLQVSSTSIKVSLTKSQPARQHQQTSELTSIFMVNGRRLTLKNDGHCPDDCIVNVTVRDEREGKVNETIWTFTGNNMYVMTPVTITFGKLSGFVLKIWQWQLKKEKRSTVDFSKEWRNSHSNLTWTGFPSKGVANEEIENLKQKKKAHKRSILKENLEFPAQLKRLKRTSEWSEDSVSSDSITVHHVRERVVLITFNETDSHIVNASQSEITQLCKNFRTCQPELYSQKRSLLITDLDQDESQELISYTSTYVMGETGDAQKAKNDYRTWRLQSRVRVVPLQAELHKLYEALMRP